MSNITEADLIYNQMTASERARAWEIFGQVQTGQITREQADRARVENERRARETLGRFFGGNAASVASPVTPIIPSPEQDNADETEPPASPRREPSAVFQGLAGFLNSIGLGSLFQFAGGRPSGWLWEQIKAGIETQDELLFALEQTPEFRQRFSVIFRMREANAPYVPTASQVLEYEKNFFQLMNNAGVPSWFYDSNDDAQRAMETGLAITQVEDRLQRGFEVMQRMPSEVKDVFAEYYGQSAENAMLAAILDPKKTLNEIDRSVRIGQIGGFARRAGFEVARAQAERFGEVPMSETEIRQGVQTAAEFRPLTVETFGERQDLTETTALEAGLGGSAVDRALLENRLRTRQVQQSSVGGGATISGTGVTGAGVI